MSTNVADTQQHTTNNIYRHKYKYIYIIQLNSWQKIKILKSKREKKRVHKWEESLHNEQATVTRKKQQQ